jgi:ankyrin repeat protein
MKMIHIQNVVEYDIAIILSHTKIVDKKGFLYVPLFVASQQGRCNVKCLLSSGEDINLSDKYRQSPLFVASQQGRCKMLQAMVIFHLHHAN